MPTVKPKGSKLWAYRVGFGDCLLLEIQYERDTRFVLFDFGTKKLPSRAKNGMLAIAKDIADRVTKAKKGKLVAIVATHRHQDHISGFRLAKGKGPGDVLAALKPLVVVQPWTDDPEAKPDYEGPVSGGGKGLRAKSVGSDPLGFTPATLSLIHQFLAGASAHAAMPDIQFAKNTRTAVRAAAENGLKNPYAIKFLADVCPRARHDFVYAHGPAKNLASVLPGVGIRVLGPPTIHDEKKIFAGYAKSAPTEYWKLRMQRADERAFWLQANALQQAATATARHGNNGPFKGAATVKSPPFEARWVTRKVDRERGESLFAIVRFADHVLNNTSVMLLLTIGNKRLLFPGDAQLETWQHALHNAKDAAAIRRELAQVDLYKVGHHGSLNATPKKSLWEGFAKRGGKNTKGRLRTVLSTQKGVFGGKKSPETEVPSPPLFRALNAESELHTTDAKGTKGLAIEILI